MNQSQSDQYINRMSATVLAFIKIIEGVFAVYALYLLLRMFAPLFSQVMSGSFDIAHALEEYLSKMGVYASISDSAINAIISEIAMPLALYAGYFLAVVLTLLLIAVEAAAIVLLRFKKMGAVLVRTVHQIRLGVWVAYLLSFIYTIFTFFKYQGRLKELAANQRVVLSGVNITLVIFGVIILIVILLHLCYHKDIAMAMNTVKYEIETGQQRELKKTHLSGISFLFGMPYLILIFAVVAGARRGTLNGVSNLQKIMGIIFLIAAMIKYYSICLCNHNLKQAR